MLVCTVWFFTLWNDTGIYVYYTVAVVILLRGSWPYDLHY
jgi:hypothetical protein